VVAVTYTVRVSREGTNWIADVVDLPGAHTYAGNLTALWANVHEVIQLVLDEPEGSDPHPLHVELAGGDDMLEQAINIGEERVAAEAGLAATQRAATAMVHALAESGYSMRDIAGALRMTAGRVSQILNAERGTTPTVKAGSRVTPLPAPRRRRPRAAGGAASRTTA
jgi:predicted RNase H-like HicB family nuclease